MSELAPDNARRPVERLRQANMAELVAAAVRRRILAGELADGDVLPKQDDLAGEFGTSAPSVREGLRILEGEGLITVRRGRFGGAVVHAPAESSTAYMLGLVLQSRQVRLTEIGEVLRDLEPVCAGLCAARADRRRTVLPTLRRLHEAASAPEVTLVEGTRLGRRFHGELVAQCGRETMVVLIGVLESIWWSHSEESAQRGRLANTAPRRDYLERRNDDHEQMIAVIDDGDVDAATLLARRHLEESTLYTAGGTESRQVVDAGVLAQHAALSRDGGG